MGYCVYQMPAVQEAPLDYSSNIHDLVQQLHQANPADHRGFLPFLEPLGQNWFKKRYDKYRLVAKLISVPVGHCQVPVVVLVDFLHRADPAYGSGKAVDFEQR